MFPCSYEVCFLLTDLWWVGYKEFIHLVSSQANELCDKQLKKTMTGEHVMQALESLGFGDYNESVQKEQLLYKENAKAGMYKIKRQDSDIPVEEMLEEQRKMFAKAKERQAAPGS